MGRIVGLSSGSALPVVPLLASLLRGAPCLVVSWAPFYAGAHSPQRPPPKDTAPIAPTTLPQNRKGMDSGF